MHKFFVPKESICDNRVIIQGEDVKHILKVLRLKQGTVISINNCVGQEYIGEIISADKKEVLVKIKEEVLLNNESPIQVFLFQGLPKSSKMDLIVQKATELGVKEITPVITERVVVKNEIGEYKKLDRWQRIALEACKQSKRSLIPTINSPIEFEKLIEFLKNMDLIVVPYENQEGYGIKKVIQGLHREIKKVGIVIGPEGGFEEEEIEKLKEIGAHIVTLGPRILRTETAGFVCAALIMYEIGDLGGKI